MPDDKEDRSVTQQNPTHVDSDSYEQGEREELRDGESLRKIIKLMREDPWPPPPEKDDEK